MRTSGKSPGNFQGSSGIFQKLGGVRLCDPHCPVQPPNSRITPKSIGEGASGLLGEWPGSPENVSCSSATPELHQCNLGVALEQETFSGLPGHPPERLLAPAPIDFRGNPGIRGLYRAIRVAKPDSLPATRQFVSIPMWFLKHFGGLLPENSGRAQGLLPEYLSGHVRPRQGTEICNFGAPSPLEALHWIFCFCSSVYVQFSKTSPVKSGESSETSSGENRVKSCHVCGCHGFFGPESRASDRSPPPTPRKGAPTRGGVVFLNKASVEFFSGLSQEFLLRAPGRLPNKSVLELPAQLKLLQKMPLQRSCWGE